MYQQTGQWGSSDPAPGQGRRSMTKETGGRRVSVSFWTFEETKVSIWYFNVCVWDSPHRVRPQGSNYFGQRQLPQLLYVRSVDQTLCGVQDVILHNKEAAREGGQSTETQTELLRQFGKYT